MKTILFDLDGTLIQTPKIILDAFKLTFNKFVPSVNLNESELSNFLGQTLWKTFGTYMDNQETIEEMVTYYREISNDMIEMGLSAYPNAKQTIKYLKKQGCKIGIVTSKMKEVAKYHLKLTDLFDEIDGIIGYEDVINHKPDPEPIYKALELFSAKKDETIYIGDHENDIKAAKKAGIESCAVTYSIRLKEMLLEQPEYVIDDLKNLEDIV